MIIGLIGALAQRDFRRVLSFNLVGHLGYTTVGLALMTQTAMAASILYVFHHIFVITNLYLISGIFLRLRRTTDFASLGSIFRDYPGVTLIAMIPLFSLAGVPPLSGFIGKLALIRADHRRTEGDDEVLLINHPLDCPIYDPAVNISCQTSRWVPAATQHA